jgi:hypothetical protein
MTEDVPLAATTVKGQIRAAVTRELLAAAEARRVRIAIGRASDFFGPGVTGYFGIDVTLGPGHHRRGVRDGRRGHPGLPGSVDPHPGRRRAELDGRRAGARASKRRHRSGLAVLAGTAVRRLEKS